MFANSMWAARVRVCHVGVGEPGFPRLRTGEVVSGAGRGSDAGFRTPTPLLSTDVASGSFRSSALVFSSGKQR